MHDAKRFTFLNLKITLKNVKFESNFIKFYNEIINPIETRFIDSIVGYHVALALQL